MDASVEIERWFAATRPPAEQAMRKVRSVIIGADQRMREYVKHGAVQFACGGDFAAFVQPKKPGVRLMFYRGGLLKGRYPHLEGEGRAVRFMRFTDAAEVSARAAELRGAAREWCERGSGREERR